MTGDTTREPTSLGHPCLLFSMGGMTSTHEPQRAFALVDGVTTIGSAPESDLCLPDLEPHHAEIRLNDIDDYVYTPLCADAAGSVNGQPGRAVVLRTGTRIVFGSWTVSFYREEMSDKSVGKDTPSGKKFAQMRRDAASALSSAADAANVAPTPKPSDT